MAKNNDDKIFHVNGSSTFYVNVLVCMTSSQVFPLQTMSAIKMEHNGASAIAARVVIETMNNIFSSTNPNVNLLMQHNGASAIKTRVVIETMSKAFSGTNPNVNLH